MNDTATFSRKPTGDRPFIPFHDARAFCALENGIVGRSPTFCSGRVGDESFDAG